MCCKQNSQLLELVCYFYLIVTPVHNKRVVEEVKTLEQVFDSAYNLNKSLPKLGSFSLELFYFSSLLRLRLWNLFDKLTLKLEGFLIEPTNLLKQHSKLLPSLESESK